MSAAPDRDRHGQLVVSSENGDCFRACMSVLLGVPNGDHLPNEHGPGWWAAWWEFLWDLGLAVSNSHAKGPVWKSHPWIASVRSKNFGERTHAIVMDGHKVLFDPSPLRRYHAGWSLLGKDVVLAGTWLEVADATRLDRLVEFQSKLREGPAS